MAKSGQRSILLLKIRCFNSSCFVHYEGRRLSAGALFGASAGNYRRELRFAAGCGGALSGGADDAQSAIDARYCAIDFLERVVERRRKARNAR